MRADLPPEPVFVDRTGTRRRWWTTFGVLSAAVLSLVAAGILAGLLGSGTGGVLPGLPGLPVPARDGGRAAGSAPPSDPASGGPSSRRATPTSRAATPGPTATPTPGAPVPTPGASNRSHGNPHNSKRP
jgi:hypothetical protein